MLRKNFRLLFTNGVSKTFPTPFPASFFLPSPQVYAFMFFEHETDTLPLPDVDQKIKQIPLYHVVLLDDNEHTYAYVVEMLSHVFGYGRLRSFKMACEVDAAGRVIVCTTHKERAEHKRDQIQTYGADWRIPHCSGSMSAVIEPVEEIE